MSMTVAKPFHNITEKRNFLFLDSNLVIFFFLSMCRGDIYTNQQTQMDAGIFPYICFKEIYFKPLYIISSVTALLHVIIIYSTYDSESLFNIEL